MYVRKEGRRERKVIKLKEWRSRNRKRKKVKEKVKKMDGKEKR